MATKSIEGGITQVREFTVGLNKAGKTRIEAAYMNPNVLEKYGWKNIF